MYSEKQQKHYAKLSQAAGKARRENAYNTVAYGIVLKHARKLRNLNTPYTTIIKLLKRDGVPISYTQLKKIEERYQEESLDSFPHIEALLDLPISNFQSLTQVPNSLFPGVHFEKTCQSKPQQKTLSYGLAILEKLPW